jgi:hypothetical protein
MFSEINKAGIIEDSRIAYFTRADKFRELEDKHPKENEPGKKHLIILFRIW